MTAVPLRPQMPVAADDVLVGGQVGGAHGAAGVELVGADADLGAQAVLAAVGEAGRGVDHHAGGIDGGDEAVGRGHAGVRMASVWCEPYSLMWSMASSSESTTFTATIRSRYSVYQSSSVAGLAAANSCRVRSQPRISTPCRQQLGRPSAAGSPATSLWNRKRLDRVAHARPLALGVDADVADLLGQLGGAGVDVDVAVAGVVLDDRDASTRPRRRG